MTSGSVARILALLLLLAGPAGLAPAGSHGPCSADHAAPEHGACPLCPAGAAQVLPSPGAPGLAPTPAVIVPPAAPAPRAPRPAGRLPADPRAPPVPPGL